MLCAVLCQLEHVPLSRMLWVLWKGWVVLHQCGGLLQGECMVYAKSWGIYILEIASSCVIYGQTFPLTLCSSFPSQPTSTSYQPGAPCLPCGCCGPKIEGDGCSGLNVQAHCCCCVASAALPCNDEVPVAVTVAGLTLFPKCGCMVPIKEVMNR